MTAQTKGSGPHKGGSLLWAVLVSLDVNKNAPILMKELLKSLGLFWLERGGSVIRFQDVIGKVNSYSESQESESWRKKENSKSKAAKTGWVIYLFLW